MSKINRVFPNWHKSKKGERMPGSFPPKPKFSVSSIREALAEVYTSSDDEAYSRAATSVLSDENREE